MQNIVAVSQLIIRRNQVVHQGEQRNLAAREKLSKKREEVYKSFRKDLKKAQEDQKNPFSPGSLLGTLGLGAAGAGLLRKIRGGRGGPGGRPGRGGRPGPGGGRVKPGNRIVPGPRSRVPGRGGLRGGLRMGRFNAVATTALTGVDYGMRLSEGQTQTQAVSGALSTTAGGLAGMAAGAKGGALLGGSIGALFGGVGAVPGAAIGGVLGGLLGSFTGASLGANISDSLTGVGQSADKRRQLEIQKARLSGPTKMKGSNKDYDEAVTKLENLLFGDDDRTGDVTGLPLIFEMLNKPEPKGEPPADPSGQTASKPTPETPPSFQEQLAAIQRKAIPAEVGNFIPDMRKAFVDSGGETQTVDTPYGRLIMSRRPGIFDPNRSLPRFRFISNEETALRREYTQKTLDNPFIGGFLVAQDVLNQLPITGSMIRGMTRRGGNVRGNTSVNTRIVDPKIKPSQFQVPSAQTQRTMDTIFGKPRKPTKTTQPQVPEKPSGVNDLFRAIDDAPMGKRETVRDMFNRFRGRLDAIRDSLLDKGRGVDNIRSQRAADQLRRDIQGPLSQRRAEEAQQSGSGLMRNFLDRINPFSKSKTGGGNDMNSILAPLFLLPELLFKPQEMVDQGGEQNQASESSDDSAVLPFGAFGANKYGIDTYSYLDILN
jgi:hypothetical protein|tara:strand:+ start:4453 stop:6417 length:1965 start_codon:yes stop_codon:yes gene_type:complete